MYDIRSYEDRLHPDLFRRGGVLGISIFILNFFRWKLEVFVQYLVLRYMLREQKFSLKKMEEVLATFSLDVQKENLECRETSPLRVFPLLQTPKVDKPKETGPTVTEVSTPSVGVRGQSLDSLFQKYAPRRGRNARYQVGEDQFEPLTPEAPPPPTEDKGIGQ